MQTKNFKSFFFQNGLIKHNLMARVYTALPSFIHAHSVQYINSYEHELIWGTEFVTGETKIRCINTQTKNLRKSL